MAGLVTDLRSLMPARLMGIGEQGNFTAAAKALSEWFPAKEKGLAVGLCGMGCMLGAVVAAPLAA